MIEFENARCLLLNDSAVSRGPVVYWMSRDQRVQDNWALLYAYQKALEQKSALAVVFCLVPEYLGAVRRQFSFMLEGLRQVEKDLGRLNIPFFVLRGQPQDSLPLFIAKNKIKALVTDFSPLRINRKWKDGVSEAINIPFYEIDAHNIIPCRVASPKQEYAAYTFRPKVQRLLPKYLTDFPPLKKFPFAWNGKKPENDWDGALHIAKSSMIPGEVQLYKPGEKQAHKTLTDFLDSRLPVYHDQRNDPSRGAVSCLSPYLHFGQISAQRVALEAQRQDDNIKSQESFLEELIVRRELSDNFCFYNPKYDSFEGFPDWARKTLDDHRSDERRYIYSRDDLEQGLTHDPLWNVAQSEMVVTGKMHGYMRMYWAKKLLEWSASPEMAVDIAIYLNDRYELDGRDSNGYTGIAWSIGGVHDRAWKERDIFGKIRFMSYDGCRRKFDIEAYISGVEELKLKVSR